MESVMTYEQDFIICEALVKAVSKFTCEFLL